MLPEGWQRSTLGEIATFKNGLNFTKSDEGEAIKIVVVSDFKDRSELQDTNDLDSVRVATKVRESELLASGDLLFVRSNGNRELIGRCLFFPEVKERLAYSGFTIRGRVDRTVLSPAFASYLMRSKLVKDQIFLGGSGTNISNLSQEILSSIELFVPPLGEQKGIARVLSTWDQVIATTERLLANSRRQKHSLLNVLMRRIRHAQLHADKWDHIDLDAIFERVTRKNTVGNTNVLTISGERGLISQRDYFNKSVASANLSGYTLLLRGEFAYNKSYSAGYPMDAIKPLTNYETGVVSSLYLCFRIRGGVDACADYFRHYFEAGMLNEALGGIAQEGARAHGLLNVGVSDFFKLRLKVPSTSEQRHIAEVINIAEAEENTIERQLECLKKEKAALMAQLLTGKRRVRLPASAGEVIT